MQIAALRDLDAPRYRSLMLEAYALAPDAFTSTLAERTAEPMDWWLNRLAPASGLGQAFGAFDGPSLVGAVGLEYSAKPKIRHSALLIGMYVQPAARGLGVGRALVQAAIEAALARGGILTLQLTVTEGNTPAIRLYESLGFRAWGTEPLAMRTPAGLRGKVYMWRPMAEGPGDGA